MVDSNTFNGQAFCYRQNKARKIRQSPDTVEELNHLFPGSCDILGIAAQGIVLTPSACHSGTPMEYQDGEAGYALMFPSIEGVNIRPFHFCKKTFSQAALQEAGGQCQPPAHSAYKTGGARFLNLVLEPLAKSKALIAGGIVENVFSPARRCCGQGAYGVVGLALSGARVQGASVLLEEDVSSPREAEATIQRLKAAGLPERNTLGFMFACVGRGHNFYGHLGNVEADAFRKVFPHTPLFGLFGNGEIGCDRVVKQDYTLCDGDAGGLQHAFTTVMTLVHLG
ncbi:hypothetical protein CRUP_027445 [Coryphaenoides rupestris]|nr:hypothetical protein CRUP_027445 [Coryphaenoides rupestris]